jgi:glucans biosynthesis protein C
VLTLALCAAAFAVARRVPGLALLLGIQRRPQPARTGVLASRA